MLTKQVGCYLMGLFFFTHGAFYIVVFDTSVEGVWKTTVLGVLSFTFWQA